MYIYIQLKIRSEPGQVCSLDTESLHSVFSVSIPSIFWTHADVTVRVVLGFGQLAYLTKENTLELA